jgi:hypothetical protein
MPVLHLRDQQFPLAPGPTRLGAPDAAEVPVAAGLGVQAVVDVQPGSGVTIRRAGPEATVRVNGVQLGAEPTPLLHGDRIEVAGVELRYADDQKGGATQFVASGEISALAARRTPSVATSGTGGRLVSLVDGKEYAIPLTGLVIGREVGADVVVPLAEVSRRHCEIVPTGDGYRLTDLSTNGVLVNGERVSQSRLLNRSDVIRIGSEEFRFYADVVRPAPAMTGAGTTPEPAAPAAAVPESIVAVPAAAPAAGQPAAAQRPAPRRPAPRPEPARTASGRLRFWVWFLLLVVIIAAALLVMG